MYLKKLIDKKIFDKKGYVILDTDLKNNIDFNNLINQFTKALKSELESPAIKKLGGYTMGNFGLNQGPLGLKLYSVIFKKNFVKYFEKITSKKINEYHLNYGGNVVLPKKGDQHFHTDGKYNEEMYLISVVTEKIHALNGPTEICVGTNRNEMSISEFYFTKKKKLKLFMKKGQILIRKHNLWHRGTKNKTNKPRLLLSFIMIPKVRNKKIVKLSNKFKILPNFFSSDLKGKIHEIIYVRAGFLIFFVKIIFSIFTNFFLKKIKN